MLEEVKTKSSWSSDVAAVGIKTVHTNTGSYILQLNALLPFHPPQNHHFLFFLHVSSSPTVTPPAFSFSFIQNPTS
ncbi:hypothetical protein VIGAN_05242300 [Vigna angularis var. angularis]|uniref:Uncharacterized protein n=1 Tax=Vigna angularis var. angularis TaxID=157739 RepID=A0A0S3S7K0_PHAAN|nr:hypothetical protein VIGAN_05242300 [Vigna angularis var. angularis]